jgi:7-keto-8-aminopelargonate synthetase-like enzyme/aryl carrier-like protein
MSLPKTTSGKVRRKETRRALADNELPVLARWRADNEVPCGTIEPVSLSEEWMVVRRAVEQVLGRQMEWLYPETCLAEVGLDSIQTLELVGVLEKAQKRTMNLESMGPESPLQSFFDSSPRAPLSAQNGRAQPPPEKPDFAYWFSSVHSEKDILARCSDFHSFLSDWKGSGQYNFFSIRKAGKGTQITLQTAYHKSVPCISFSGYDYLGLSHHPEVIQAAHQAAEEFGISPTAAPPLAGRTGVHRQLECELATWLEKEDCVLFSNAFAANVGALSALLRPGDLVVYDALSHASLQDGIQAGQAAKIPFRHNDVDHLESILSQVRHKYSGGLLVTEGLFSMDGDAAPIRAIVDACQRYGMRLYVDQAHCFGALGNTGRGAVEMEDCIDSTDFIVGSLSKAIGGGGGFVAGTTAACEWIRHLARSGLFSGGLATPVAAASMTSVKLLQDHPEWLSVLRGNIHQFKQSLRSAGVPNLHSHDHSPIVPMIVGSPAELARANDVLVENGIYTSCVTYPAVPINACRFRWSVNRCHTAQDIEAASTAVHEAIHHAAGIELREQIQ